MEKWNLKSDHLAKAMQEKVQLLPRLITRCFQKRLWWRLPIRIESSRRKFPSSHQCLQRNPIMSSKRSQSSVTLTKKPSNRNWLPKQWILFRKEALANSFSIKVNSKGSKERLVAQSKQINRTEFLWKQSFLLPLRNHLSFDRCRLRISLDFNLLPSILLFTH